MTDETPEREAAHRSARQLRDLLDQLEIDAAAEAIAWDLFERLHPRTEREVIDVALAANWLPVVSVATDADDHN